MLRGYLAMAAVLAVAGSAAAQPVHPPPMVEVVVDSDRVDLPPVPQLDAPAAIDGVHSVLGLLVRGESFFGREVVVRGRVTWIYDCATHGGSFGPVGPPKATRRQKLKIIAQKPQLCWRPHFVIADDLKLGSPEMWVVDVPRPLRPDERKRMTKEQIGQHPQPPAIKVGEEIVLSGRFDSRSPTGFANSNGLLVYGALVK